MSRTYAILAVTRKTYEEIRKKLANAGYAHALHDDIVDMHGIALKVESGGYQCIKPSCRRRYEDNPLSCYDCGSDIRRIR